MKTLRPLVHLLLPLCVHWVAEEMTVSVLVDVTTNALCPGHTTCPQAIYVNGVQQTVVGIFKMIVLPLLGQLADDYGRKPLLLLTVSTTIVPFTLLAINQSRSSVYAYYILRTVSYIISQGSIFCIAVAYAADVVEDSKRAVAFSWITGLFSASHVVGNILARFLPEDYIFEVSIALLIFVPLYMSLFLTETRRPAQKANQRIPFFKKTITIVQERYHSMRTAVNVVTDSTTLNRISLISFFYELGMSGISGVLLYYLKSVFGFDKNQLSEILMMVGVGSIFSQMLLLPILNPIVGEKLILCAGLLASVAYGLLYGLAWAPWVPYLSASFGVIYILVKPSVCCNSLTFISFTPCLLSYCTLDRLQTYAVISLASNSADQGKAQGFIAGVQSIASLLSPLAMSPLTTWFLSDNAPFDCKGFSIIFASISMVISLWFAWTLNLNAHKTVENNENDDDDIETPLLS
ncbi:uncharacterized protein LOC127243844 isoform X1 [Andrographis paniculata]|uniref:uncharacterized protein LOC127243844 isoform X1 n=1 Tax=Andrographis paniculata TaxID=175694 RepID=UPI0021E983C1|nr:uncharacterized protein LOC127243844 isoform X1 [Andrographis paniculata]